jgi:type II restriction enzyme
MDLSLNAALAEDYKSPAQQARVVTEAWVAEHLYCLGCAEDELDPTRRGKQVVDFLCGNCERRYQLKSQRRPFGRKVVDAAWGPMASAIRSGTVPNFLFLHYNHEAWRVTNLFGVPSHFMTLSALERRKPLPPTARRAGWVGCNILLDALPPDARVSIVREERARPAIRVREEWSRFEFLAKRSHESRGWTADVLARVRRLDQRMFTLQDIYAFEEELSKLHPKNRHVRAKIRQQLQVLRDRGILKFLNRGLYLVLK